MYNKEVYQKYKLANLERVRATQKASKRRFKLKQVGITEDKWQTTFDSQHGLCAICQTKLQRNGREVHMDHCHKTGKFRGILCHHCNRGIGMLGDNPDRLIRAAEYLKETS
jgi:hypothetical protein